MPKNWQIPRDIPWTSPYPLPRDTAEVVLEQENDGRPSNASLLMDRLLPYARGREGPQIAREFANRAALVPDLSGLADLITARVARWDALASSLGATTFTLQPEWRAIVGLGTHVLLEGGLLLDRIYGLPLVPAAALKGVTRLCAEQVEEIGEGESAELFGTADDEANQGDLLFLDGVPAGVPQLERDVVNSHMAMFYGSQGNIPPADYLSPRPVFLLTVGKNSLFRFGIASIRADRTSVARGSGWLRQALGEIGIGAKTAAGYGYWVKAT